MAKNQLNGCSGQGTKMKETKNIKEGIGRVADAQVLMVEQMIDTAVDGGVSLWDRLKETCEEMPGDDDLEGFKRGLGVLIRGGYVRPDSESFIEVTKSGR